MKIGIITGSTREGRKNNKVAEYVLDFAKKLNADAEFELVDIKDFDLPMFNSMPPGMLHRQYDDPRISKWSEKIDSLDGFIFVISEYNKSVTPALLNAYDLISPEWHNKAAGLIGFGSTGAVTALQLFRITLSQSNIAVLGTFADFSLFTDFDADGNFVPQEFRKTNLEKVINGTVNWAKAMKTVRD